MMRRRTRRPVFAGLDADQLLELIEETNTARVLAARGEIAAADACFAAVVARLDIVADVDYLTAHLPITTPKEGDR